MAIEIGVPYRRARQSACWSSLQDFSRVHVLVVTARCVLGNSTATDQRAEAIAPRHPARSIVKPMNPVTNSTAVVKSTVGTAIATTVGGKKTSDPSTNGAMRTHTV